jgi:branched-chain amino acid transport system permease protein
MGRAFRAIRDDEIAASLCGYSVARVQLTAFVFSAACAGLGGAMLAVVLQLAAPGAFQLQLSLSLLTAIVVGGLGSLAGAAWGAAFLVLLPGWSNDIAHSFSLSTRVSSNLPLAIYGAVLIAVMLAWPTGIQGGVRAAIARLRRVRGGTSAPRESVPIGRGPGPEALARGRDVELSNQRGDQES